MGLKQHVISEFDLRVFEESYSRIYKCLALMDDEDLWKSPNKNVPSIGSLILHLCGNARQWILAGIGEEDDNRNRDEEFKIHKNIRKSDFVFLLGNMKVQLQRCLRDLDDKKLEQSYIIQGFNVTGFSALIHVIEHFSYHTGQITTLTKLYTNQDTGYYADLDLNKLNNFN